MRTRTNLTRLAVAVFAVAALASCGDDDGGSGGGGSVAAWCGLMDQANEVDAALSGATNADPVQLEASMKRATDVAELVVAAAPAEIAADAGVLADSTKKLDDALAAADYRLLDADFSAMSDPAEQERVDQAQANLDTFSIRECGQPFGNSDANTESSDSPPDTTGGFDLGEGTIREQLATYFVSIGLTPAEAECLAAQADPTDSDLLAGDSAAILKLFAECGISEARLAELGG